MRTTNKQIEALTLRINKLLGKPETSWTKLADGKQVANIGHYHHWATDNGHNLAVMCTEGGGIHSVLYAPTRRELAASLNAFILGISEGKAVK